MNALPALEVDPCGLAILLATVTGLAAVADPALVALSFALVALGLGAFLMGMRPRHGGQLALDAPTLAAFSILALGGIAFFEAPAAIATVRAFLFALSATPLWWVHRSGAPVSRGGTS